MLAQRSTVGTLLAYLAHAMPQQEAVVWPPQRLTYAALYAQATAVAGGLWGLGIRHGEPVALLVSNRPEWLTTALGCALIGAPVVALSTWSRRVELEYALDHSQAVALVTLDRFLGADYQAMLGEIIPEATRCPPGQIDAARLPALRELMVLGQPALAAARPFDEVLARGRNLDPVGVHAASAGVQPTDLLYVLYTSGSTARPKGVTLAHAACLENGFHIGERQHLTRADRLWLAVPLCWSFAAANALMALLTHGGTVVLQERFDAEAAVRLIAAERCTVYYGMSHMAQAMLETPAWGHVDTHALCKDRQGSLRSSQPTVARPCSTEACRMHSEKAMQREGGHVVVIGGSSGIGLAAARLAQHEGAEVTIAGRSQERLLQAHQELGQVHMVMMDMTMRVPSRRSM